MGSSAAGVEIAATDSGDRCLMRVAGELDLATAPAIELAIDALAFEGRPVELDLSGVTFIDAAGFNMLIDSCVLPRADAEVQIVARSPAVHRMLELALDALQSGA